MIKSKLLFSGRKLYKTVWPDVNSNAMAGASAVSLKRLPNLFFPANQSA